MKKKYIKARVRNLVKTHGTRNPEILANELGITILKKPYKSTKGFFSIVHGKKLIAVNSTLDEATQVIVIAHELGHAILHSSEEVRYLHAYTLNNRIKNESNANKFAAELLINENDIDKHYLKEMSISQLACYYGVPEQLIRYKFISKQ